MATTEPTGLRPVNGKAPIVAKVSDGSPFDYYNQKTNEQLLELIEQGFLHETSAQAVMKVLVTRLLVADKLIALLAPEKVHGLMRLLLPKFNPSYLEK